MSKRRGRYTRPAPQKGELSPTLAKAAADFNSPAGGPFSRSLASQAKIITSHFDSNNRDGVIQGPGVPPAPMPLDNTGEPRTWQYRTGWNLPSLPGEGRSIDMQTLRDVSNVYDILRKAIEVRKDEFCNLRFSVIARDPDRRRARQVIRDQQSKIREIEDFFVFPDRRSSWQSWLRMMLEDYFSVDAVTLWKWRTLDGRLHGLRVLDGALIKPLLNINGDPPLPPDPAYQQYVWGVPRWSFTTDELIYAPKNRRTFTPYGFSPVEQFLTHVILSLRYQRFHLDYFTDGTLPEGVAEAPATWSSKQIQEFSSIWNDALSGDSRALHKLRFVPAGFKWHQFKQFDFNTDFARWLVGVTCAAMDLMPSELGFEPLHGGLGGKGFSEEQSLINKRKAIRPLKRWLLDEIINPIIWEEFDAPELVGTLLGENEVEEQLQQTQARDIAIRNGTMTIDQAIEEEGGEPVGIDRIFVYGTNVLGLPDLKALSTVGTMALNVKGSPAPEGSRQLPAGVTATEEPQVEAAEVKAGLPIGRAGAVPKTPVTPDGQSPKSAAPPKPKDPIEEARKKLKTPDEVVTNPHEALVQAMMESQVAGQSGAEDDESDNISRGDSSHLIRNRGPDQSRSNLATANKSVDLQSVTAELAAFARFAKKRHDEGRWRDFRSDVIPPDVLERMNRSAEQQARRAS